jgi:hypothetical protein
VAPTGGAPLTAGQVAARLATAGLPLTVVVVYTASTDPNHLLGRSGGYTSKVAFTDPRVPEQDRSSVAGSVENGGSVEVYPDAAGATARADYVRAFAAGSPALFGEYTYTRGTVVLHVSRFLTPEQAAGYEAALATLPG